MTINPLYTNDGFIRHICVCESMPKKRVVSIYKYNYYYSESCMRRSRFKTSTSTKYTGLVHPPPEP